MNFGKQRIHDLPINDIIYLGVLAQQLQQEAKERGETLPPLARLQVGEPSFRTPEHIRHAAMQAIAIGLSEARKKGAKVPAKKH
jgi:aspartate/methionine/tyrosine aminotransferase